VHGDTGRDPQWEMGAQTDLGDADAEKSTFEKTLYHVPLSARDKDGKADKIVKKLHIVFKNEW